VEAVGLIADDIARGVQQSRLYEQERRLVADLRELDRTKTEFLSTVSHELRTPLTSISGFVELLFDPATGALNEEQERMLEIVERNTNRLRGLIEDLLTLSRIEAGTFRTVREPTDVADLVKAAVRAIRASASPDIAVELSAPAGPMLAQVDPRQIDRALVNLLSNAVKFTLPGGAVTVTAAEDGADIVVSVSDTGIGIPSGEQGRLFTRFFRASTAQRAAVAGVGLGLSITKAITTAHGGTLDLHSVEGTGTTFTLTLPRTTA
jgi:signal transduction histidine kinase